jgi:hypothetical protein
MWRSIDEEQDRKHSDKSCHYALAVNHAAKAEEPQDVA